MSETTARTGPTSEDADDDNQISRLAWQADLCGRAAKQLRLQMTGPGDALAHELDLMKSEIVEKIRHLGGVALLEPASDDIVGGRMVHSSR